MRICKLCKDQPLRQSEMKTNTRIPPHLGQLFHQCCFKTRPSHKGENNLKLRQFSREPYALPNLANHRPFSPKGKKNKH